jgi:hypothetical protein
MKRVYTVPPKGIEDHVTRLDAAVSTVDPGMMRTAQEDTVRSTVACKCTALFRTPTVSVKQGLRYFTAHVPCYLPHLTGRVSRKRNVRAFVV